MTFLKYILVATLFLGVIFSIPFFIQARDRAITIDSLEKAFASRVTAIDTEIASTTKASERIGRLPYNTSFNDPQVVYKRELNAAIVRLNEEKRTTETVYNLLVEALK